MLQRAYKQRLCGAQVSFQSIRIEPPEISKMALMVKKNAGRVNHLLSNIWRIHSQQVRQGVWIV